MQMLSAHDVASRVREVGSGIIATDADGTLWSGDVGVDAFEAVIEQRAIRAEAVDGLRAMAREAGVLSGDDPHAWALGINAACEQGTYSEARTYEMMAWLFAGWGTGQVRAFVREVLGRRGIGGRVHREMTHVLTQVPGICVVVVSASPQIVVEEALTMAAIRASAVVAARPAEQDGRVMACMAEPIPFGPGKVRALRAHVGEAPIAAAFGDNTFDIEMLRSAAVPVAVRPKPRLRERCSEIAGIVELAPQAG